MSLHKTTFEYLKPTDAQLGRMGHVRMATKMYADALDLYLPDGADKTYLMRKVREVNMWAMIAITRNADGSPKE